MRFFGLFLVVALVVLLCFAEEAAAGGESTTKAVHTNAARKNVPVAKVLAKEKSSGAKEAAEFAKRLKGTESKMIQAKDENQKIRKVAKKLHADLHRATLFVNKVGAPGAQTNNQNGASHRLAPKVEAPALGESNALFGTKKQSLGEVSDPKMVGPLAKLASAVEADATHDIWSKEIKADKLSHKVKTEAGKIVADLLSEEESQLQLGEASILHDMAAKTKTVSPLDSEKMTLDSSQALVKVANKEHQAQVAAESQTQLVANQFTALKKDLSKHASQLGATHVGPSAPAWVKNDVSLLNEMTTEAQRIAEVEKLK